MKRKVVTEKNNEINKKKLFIWMVKVMMENKDLIVINIYCCYVLFLFYFCNHYRYLDPIELFRVHATTALLFFFKWMT